MRHDPSDFDPHRALRGLAARITEEGRVVLNPKNPAHRLEVAWATPRPHDLGFAIIERPDGEILSAVLTEEGCRIATPDHLFEDRAFASYGEVEPTAPVDPSILAGLARLDLTALTSLRLRREFSLELYRLLRDAGPDARINRLLARAPHFALWLEITLVYDVIPLDARESRLSGFHESVDPRYWIIDRVADAWRAQWPHLPCDHDVMTSIDHTVDAVIAMPPEWVGDLAITPGMLALLAACPAEHRPRRPAAYAQALHWAAVAHGLVRLPQLGPDILYTGCDGRWSRRRKALVRLQGRMAPFDYASLHSHAWFLLMDAIGKPLHAFSSRTTTLIVGILETRLITVCTEGRTVETFLDKCRTLFEDMLRAPDGNTVALRTSTLLPPALRDLSARELLWGLGFDPDTVMTVLTDGRERDEREAQEAILAAPFRDNRRMREDRLCGSAVFHTATIGSSTYTASMTYQGPRVIPLGPDVVAAHAMGYDPASPVGLGDPEGPAPAQTLDALHAEFGLPTRANRDRPAQAPDFYNSRAAAGLKAWVASHPRLAQACAADLRKRSFAEIGDWYAWATTSVTSVS